MPEWLRILIRAGCVVAILAGIALILGGFRVTRCECVRLFNWSLGVKINRDMVRVYLVRGYCTCYRPWLHPPTRWKGLGKVEG